MKLKMKVERDGCGRGLFVRVRAAYNEEERCVFARSLLCADGRCIINRRGNGGGFGRSPAVRRVVLARSPKSRRNSQTFSFEVCTTGSGLWTSSSSSSEEKKRQLSVPPATDVPAGALFSTALC